MSSKKETKKLIAEKISKIHAMILIGNIDDAELYANDLLFKYPTSADAMEAMAAVHTEMGNEDDALDLLDKAIEKKPSYSKYMSRAQLEDGEEAVEDFNRAATLIQMKINNKNGTSNQVEDDEDSLERKLSVAFCAIANEYLCIPDKTTEKLNEVKDLVESALQKAREADSTYPEIYCLMATHQIDRGNVDEGKSILANSRQIWHPSADPNEEDAFSKASRSVRMALGDVLYRARLYEEAVAVVTRNIEELGDEVEGHCHILSANIYLEMGEFSAAKCSCKYAIQFYSETAMEDEGSQDYLQTANELLAQIRQKMAEQKANNGDEAMDCDDESSEDDDDDEADEETAGRELEQLLLDKARLEGEE